MIVCCASRKTACLSSPSAIGLALGKWRAGRARLPGIEHCGKATGEWPQILKILPLETNFPDRKAISSVLLEFCQEGRYT